jgi:MFS family permease
VQICQLVQSATAAFLLWGNLGGWLNVGEIFAAVAVFGATGAFESPAVAALLPAVVPDGTLQRATALSTAAWQTSSIAGPALGGLLLGIPPPRRP